MSAYWTPDAPANFATDISTNSKTFDAAISSAITAAYFAPDHSTIKAANSQSD